MNSNLVVVRGAGDLATGILYALKNFGYDVVAAELKNPSSIRRTVSLCEAVYENTYTVENVTAERSTPATIPSVLAAGRIPVVIDRDAKIIASLRPGIVVDATIAKKNIGTTIDMAPMVIGVGPGFTAGSDVHAVVETKRGHMLGRVILKGAAEPNSGIPGVVNGYAMERVIYAPREGIIQNIRQIGDHVEAGETIATVDGEAVTARISGTLRGLIRDGYHVTEGFKTADVDPRDNPSHCYTISDKARLIGFGVLLAIKMLSQK
jgi:xanthine dehydrogenase accessory factor